MMKPRNLRPVVTYPRDAILDTPHVATALNVSEEVVIKMGLPQFYPGARPRYVWGLVLDELARRSHPDAAAELPHRVPHTPRRRRA